MDSGNRFVFAGLDELKAALRTLPADLVAEASHIVEGAANAAVADIKEGYSDHVRSGKLQNGVEVTFTTTGAATSALIKNTDPLAWIFENGSQARHSAIGANRGSMPPGHVFVPAVITRRRQMYAQLADLLTRHGLLVSGDA